ncbi:MAG: Asp-tRNA(Asn)/Glu-tRNA(Gln) amidotransferase subunit GatB [Dehalococcoidia bacterium]|jgi:aspartyl-tRNA(Asn)/glutamyl-tRNA(Gln) amidotransferase subunit B|nr:Asp-tRNA(Asn)/Glu-tRNA(Gln) amidotransferase subunit GatB [Dehalococcoidia bacterium]|tara:strand:- start:9625 stop:11103 length:1479 start_codon:yes stop_codon:yes gene_type:complete
MALMKYESVIGLEVHAQLTTESKMFCSCPADYQGQSINTMVCPVCMGMPGSLPVINEKAVQLVIATGLALNCSISEWTKFDRKNYPYPDLMKGYQISQYDYPIAYSGYLDITSENILSTVRVNRVHLEEDVAKLTHLGSKSNARSLLDINRAGVPLMETVSEPDMRTSDQAREYLVQLRSILQFIGVSTCNMEEGNFRCDANISIRPIGDSNLGSKVEVKNMNSLRAVQGALEFEFERQVKMAEKGERIIQETRGWVDDKEITVSQRSKEDANDYRYFPEPDLPPLIISKNLVDSIQGKLPELPSVRKSRYIEDYKISEYDAGLIISDINFSNFFDDAVNSSNKASEELNTRAKTIANLLLTEVNRLLNLENILIHETKLTPIAINEIAQLLEAGDINSTVGKQVLEETFKSGISPKKIVEEKGLIQITDTDSLIPVLEVVLDNNPDAVNDYINGKDTAVRFLVGQVMKETKGKANPTLVSELLVKQLDLRK